MHYPVIKAVSYILVHATNTMLKLGSTIVQSEKKGMESEYIKTLKENLRSFEDVLNYAPNQVFIGNMSPWELKEIKQPWYENPISGKNDGQFGEIIDEFEFFALLKLCDRFNLVEINQEYSENLREIMIKKNFFTEEQLSVFDKSSNLEDINKMISSNKALALEKDEKIIGCIREAHENDPNLNAHIIYENLGAKASAVLALINLLKKNPISPQEIDYIIESSEEAIGDMNQRGGGNLAKAIGEVAGLDNASGCDVRAFCAAPVHAIILASSLVQAKIFKNVIVVAGGSSAKLGLNSKDHLKKNIPVLEDVLGGYAVLISENDGHSPIIRNDILGKLNIKSGSSPQAVMQAIVVDPLEQNNLKISDVDYYAPELHNHEITVAAGVGDIALANYKMIAAMAVKAGEIERQGINDFTKQHGVPGFAPTQGHIPSGVPAIGHFINGIKKENMKRAMIIGKGSLFLGRMTELFDGISFIMEKNPGTLERSVEKLDTDDMKKEIRNILIGAINQLADIIEKDEIGEKQ